MTTASDIDVIHQADEARYRAMIAGDARALGSLLAEDLSYTHSSGLNETKSQYLASFACGRLRYVEVEMSDVEGGSVDRIADAVQAGINRLGMDRALDLVIFADNHDVPRFANEPGLGVSEDEIRRRTMLSLDLVFTLPGIPQLYYGDELGMYGGRDPDNRRDLPVWATTAAGRAQPHPGEAVAGSAKVFERVQKLAALRKTVPALIDGPYRELWRQNGPQNPNVFAFARGSGADARLMVINNDGATTTMRIPVPTAVFPDGARLGDELGDGAPGETVLTGGRLVVDVPARSAAIYHVVP